MLRIGEPVIHESKTNESKTNESKKSPIEMVEALAKLNAITNEVHVIGAQKKTSEQVLLDIKARYNDQIVPLREEIARLEQLEKEESILARNELKTLEERHKKAVSKAADAKRVFDNLYEKSHKSIEWGTMEDTPNPSPNPSPIPSPRPSSAKTSSRRSQKNQSKTRNPPDVKTNAKTYAEKAKTNADQKTVSRQQRSCDEKISHDDGFQVQEPRRRGKTRESKKVEQKQYRIELAPSHCYYFCNGYCHNGDNCHFYHEIQCKLNYFLCKSIDPITGRKIGNCPHGPSRCNFAGHSNEFAQHVKAGILRIVEHRN